MKGSIKQKFKNISNQYKILIFEKNLEKLHLYPIVFVLQTDFSPVRTC